MGQGGAREVLETPLHLLPTGEGALLLPSHSRNPGKLLPPAWGSSTPTPTASAWLLLMGLRTEVPSCQSPWTPSKVLSSQVRSGERRLNTFSPPASYPNPGPGVPGSAHRKAAEKAKPTLTASQGSDHHTQGPGLT